MAGSDVVVCAALPRDLRSWASVKEALVENSKKLIDACVENKIKLFIPSAYEP